MDIGGRGREIGREGGKGRTDGGRKWWTWEG